LYIKDNNKVNGKQINCRFGMKGVIASNHFDGERNFVTVLQGARRYILSSPPQIKNLCLFPRDHPSARHSMVDYTNPDFTEFPEFATARATEVVLQPGDSLFLPTVWFHFIVSLTLNIQCNTRSGMEMKYNEEFAPFGYA
jgi:ribosomal protein L16 Arg81 hydroxylase